MFLVGHYGYNYDHINMDASPLTANLIYMKQFTKHVYSMLHLNFK